MSRYQIRTPENKALEDVLNELTEASWEAVCQELKVTELSERDHEAFRSKLFHAIIPHVRTFRLCGLSNICLDEVDSAPLSEHPEIVDVNPWDLVYHIFYRGDAEEFVDSITFEALEPIKRFIGPDARRDAFKAASLALRRVLGKYLYYSPVCGNTELCVFSSSAPIAPMGRH